jgi:hypothetical protein
MSRFLWALCAFFLATTPVVAIASTSTDFERPDAFRHAVNPLIGDASFIERYGTPPPPGTDPDLRVRTHLAFVHALLSTRDTSTMLAQLRDARRQNLARLREYIDAGIFPRNKLYRDQNRPCFIDDDGRICAVGYLVEQSAGRDTAERINARFQYAFVSEMEAPEVDQWIETSGLSRLELSLIQPCYDPEYHVTIERAGDQTVTIKGYVVDYCCGVKYTSFDFGDAVWSSPKSYWGASVDISHTYAFPGAYVITCAAISTDWCGNQVETKKWLINVGAAGMNLSAVEIPGGPPYRIYLTTTEELQMNCLTSALVQWQASESPRAESWYWENGVYRTPLHQYPTGGVKTIQVANNYLANCTTNQSGSVKLNVDGIPNPAPVEVSTWGRIKAMYR